MRYIHFILSNGYCGCNEDFYEEFEDNVLDSDLDGLYEDFIGNYGFLEPDSRFVDPDDYETEEEYEEAYAEYQAEISFDWEEITKEEYEENI